MGRSASAEVQFVHPRSVDLAVRALDGAPCWDGSFLVARSLEDLVIPAVAIRIIAEAGLRSDGELVQAVSDEVHELLEDAIARAIANDRATVHPLDLNCLHANGQLPAVRGKKKPKEIVVVGSKVKEVIREAGLRSDGELVQAVSDKVRELLGAAIKRCKGNNRGTVRPYDL